MNYFQSEHNNITARRKHYQRDRTVIKPSRFPGLTIDQIRAKVQQNPPSRRMVEKVLYFDSV